MNDKSVHFVVFGPLLVRVDAHLRSGRQLGQTLNVDFLASLPVSMLSTHALFVQVGNVDVHFALGSGRFSETKKEVNNIIYIQAQNTCCYTVHPS